MATNENVFSIRLVIADFYMEKPVPDLDPVYSEFRGKEIKKVPIIRVFGSNAQGQKTCMHVHGVFPYFYVPYDQKDFGSANQAIFQIAINLDKAINISLSQGGSSTQHVFKVQLVKGIPFYGYHRSEHQYLKIYMFNPRFVRRAANLLQNGAIMNKNFHPHEAHVPYILQFMIDYNLYGMSYIHVPSEIVKFRRCNASEVIPIQNLKDSQILDFNVVKKLSCSRLECDIGSNFILNRFQLIAKSSSTHTNPGIESIWHDEKLRRQKMAQSLEDDEEKLKAIPPLEVPSTQERPNVYPTESETFYRTALLSKLLAMETSLMENSQVPDQTINSTLSSTITNLTTNASLNASLATTKQQKRIFNLSKLLQNAVYPEECSQNDNLVNASFVENHLSNNNAFQQSLSMDLPEISGSEYRKLSEDESIFLEDTIVDEELVLSLTQTQHPHVPHNATLRQEDMELLDILQQLEEDNDSKIDLDSSLAPLTQDNKNFALSPERLDKETTASVLQLPSSDTDSDGEHGNDDNIHDFSVALENLDDLILKLTQSATEQSLCSPLPQTDGSDDLPKTPTKAVSTTSTTKTPPRTPTTPKQRRLTLASPIRSPRTPKSGHKYKPLPLIITNRSTGKKVFTNPADDIKTPCKTPIVEKSNNLPLVSLRKKLAMTELRRKSISAELHTEDNQNDVPVISERTTVSKRRSKRFIDLDKTHVTCNLTLRRTNDRLLKVYNVDTDAEDLKVNETDKIPGEKIYTNQSTEKDTCKNLKHSEGITKKDNKVIENEITTKSLSPTTDSKDTGLNSLANADEDSEEILHSDNETSVHLGKTPNLKRLRRSFHSTHSAKRRKIARNVDSVINSSKFENSHVVSSFSNQETPQGKITTSQDDNVINSSKFQNEILKTDKNVQHEEQQPSSETGVEIVERRSSIRLRRLSKELCKGQSVATPKVLSANEESTQKKEKFLRKSRRLACNNDRDDVSKTNNTRHMNNSSNIPETQSQLLSGIKVSSTGSIPTDSNDTKNKQFQTKTVMPLRKCRIRLKKIATDDPETRQDLSVMGIVEEPVERANTKPETKHIESPQKLNDLEITEKSEECVNTPTEAIPNYNSKRAIGLENIEIPGVSTESRECVKSSAETKPKDNIKTTEQNFDVNITPKTNNTDDYDDLKPLNSLDQTESSSSPLHCSNTDNLLKSLLKLTSSDAKEWCLIASPSLGDSSDLPLAQTNHYPSQSSSIEFVCESPLPQSSDEEIAETPPSLPVPNGGDQPEVLGVYEKSMSFQHSPLLFTQNSSPSIMPQNKHLRCTRLQSCENNSKEACITISSSNETATDDKLIPPSLESRVILTPLDLPPTRDEVLKGCVKLKLPEYEFQQPFYSNPDDVTKQKEIGFTILQINSNKLNDLEEFQSILGNDLKGLAAWRRNQLLRLGGPAMLTKYRNTQRIREYFASHKTVAIAPQMSAPSRQEVKVWLKARELLRSKGDLKEADDEREKIQRLTEEDSPIKIRRQKVTLMLNNEDGDGDGDDSDNCLDSSTRSLTLTPLTPATPLAKDPFKEEINKSFTPVTTKIERIPLERLNLQRRRHNRRVLRRVSLNQKIREALERNKSAQSSQGSLNHFPKSRDVLDKDKSSQSTDTDKFSQNSQTNSTQEKHGLIPASDESVVPHSQTSETSVSSQTALAEMDRSSFMRHIEQADVTMGCSNNNSTLNNTFGFKVALENLQQAKADIELTYLTIITLEVFVATRDDLFPNPQIDEIRCLFYAIENSIPSDHLDNDKKLPRSACGYIMVHDSRDTVAKEGRIHGIDRDIEVTIVQTEVEALEALLGLCSRWDADIYAGYEIEMSSWGFVMERAKYLCLNIAPLLSRVPSQKVRDFVDEDRDQFTDLDVETKLCGRILLDVWRLMRSEIALTSYTFENVMYHIKHKRCPWHSYRTLTEWFSSSCSRWIVIEYFLERVRGTLGLLDQLDLIGRTSEMAKLIGIQFYEVLSRGSQFRVESMMLRIAKPKNLVPLSPSVQQRAHMRAPEYLALILEPQSRFYADPVIVLDFQSLYPSMIIGYNYCFSTCLGRVEHLGQSTPFEFGASQLRVSPTMLRKLVDRDLITISPCGVVFVKSSVREGILPRMLTEILDTRQMVKQSMKIHKSNSALQRILHSRQLGLKLMANVTYGYTAANFSGRMPAVEVGDTVVSKGRETLERAIKLVESNEKWNVKVVYGDTDSMFVQVPGRNREEAFRIGEEIAEAVTKQNPHPVKLKLEKVYQPCILQTKKRYVGYMYETADQKEPVYEAKGIETVRRDGCPMVAKMLEKVLRILFESADVSQVKQYVCRQFTKLLSGRANLQDLIFAKEFRGMNGYKPNACVPALELTRKWIQTDPRHIPRRGERVPFIITNGPPGVPLIRLIRHPHEVLADEGLKINAIYYITKAIIPPLNRCLLLLGADVNEWFANLPRKILMTPALSIANEVIACPQNKSKKSTISQFFSTTNCIVDCGRQTKQGICDVCNSNATRSVIILQTKISKIERSFLSTQHICQACCGRVGDLKCGSLDCPVLYVMEVKRRDLQQIVHFRNLLEERF